jgi:hypothetical protein
MTLEKAIVQVGGCWQCGVAYVAFSRVKTSEGLKVLGSTPTSVVHAVDNEVKILLQFNFGADFD